MNKVNKSAVVNYSSVQMYDLVNDIRNYPKFLPMCHDVEIFEKKETEVRASLKIKSGFVKLDFTTYNTMIKNKHIHLNLIKGPFKSLVGDWRFDQQGENSCKVSLDMEFVFENKFVEISLGPIFRGLADKMLGTFCKRAEEIYK